MSVEVGQVWRDGDLRHEGQRFIRVDAIERKGLLRIARTSSRYGDGPWTKVTRFIRLDRIVKRFRLMKEN